MKKTLVMVGRVGSDESLDAILDDEDTPPRVRHLAVIECDEEGIKALAPFILEEVPLVDPAAVSRFEWLTEAAVPFVEDHIALLRHLPRALLRCVAEPKTAEVMCYLANDVDNPHGEAVPSEAGHAVVSLLETVVALASALDSVEGRQMLVVAESKIVAAGLHDEDLRELFALLRKAAKL